MILVNDNWEQIYDLQDISKLIRENYNEDLADELDRLIPKYSDEEYYDLECEIEEKNNEIECLESEIEDLERKYKVYKINSNCSYIGSSLVAAETAEEANTYIDNFKKIDADNKCNSWGYSNVREDDVLENVFSDVPGIIDYDIHYFG